MSLSGKNGGVVNAGNKMPQSLGNRTNVNELYCKTGSSEFYKSYSHVNPRGMSETVYKFPPGYEGKKK